MTASPPEDDTISLTAVRRDFPQVLQRVVLGSRCSHFPWASLTLHIRLFHGLMWHIASVAKHPHTHLAPPSSPGGEGPACVRCCNSFLLAQSGVFECGPVHAGCYGNPPARRLKRGAIFLLKGEIHLIAA